MPVSSTPRRTWRRDAQRNRDRILASARTLVARDGIDASVEEITRHAGVGMGTLYRHFPTKEELIDAVLSESTDELIALAVEAAAAEDAWLGLTAFLEQVLARHAGNRGLKDVIARSDRGREHAEAMRDRLRPLLRRMIDGAHAQGALRDDFTAEDVPVLLWATGRVIEATAEVAPEYWRRHLALTLDGLRPAAATQLPQPPLTRRQLANVRGRRKR
jgi:AcrR family transcriptional regulator